MFVVDVGVIHFAALLDCLAQGFYCFYLTLSSPTLPFRLAAMLLFELQLCQLCFLMGMIVTAMCISNLMCPLLRDVHQHPEDVGLAARRAEGHHPRLPGLGPS